MTIAVQCMNNKKMETPRSSTLEKVTLRSRNNISNSRDKSINSQKSNLTKDRSLRSNNLKPQNLKEIKKSLNYDTTQKVKTTNVTSNKNSTDARSNRKKTESNNSTRFKQIKSLERDTKLDRIMRLKTSKPRAESVVKMYMSVKTPKPISFKKEMNISGEISKIQKETQHSFNSDSNKSLRFDSSRMNRVNEKQRRTKVNSHTPSPHQSNERMYKKIIDVTSKEVKKKEHELNKLGHKEKILVKQKEKAEEKAKIEDAIKENVISSLNQKKHSKWLNRSREQEATTKRKESHEKYQAIVEQKRHMKASKDFLRPEDESLNQLQEEKSLKDEFRIIAGRKEALEKKLEQTKKLLSKLGNTTK